jgi:hypothetical protein
VTRTRSIDESADVTELAIDRSPSLLPDKDVPSLSQSLPSYLPTSEKRRVAPWVRAPKGAGAKAEAAATRTANVTSLTCVIVARRGVRGVVVVDVGERHDRRTGGCPGCIRRYGRSEDKNIGRERVSKSREDKRRQTQRRASSSKDGNAP